MTVLSFLIFFNIYFYLYTYIYILLVVLFPEWYRENFSFWYIMCKFRWPYWVFVNQNELHISDVDRKTSSVLHGIRWLLIPSWVYWAYLFCVEVTSVQFRSANEITRSNEPYIHELCANLPLPDIEAMHGMDTAMVS